MANELRPEPFTPAPWLKNPHLQTIYGALLAPAPRPALRRERWETPDNDFVDVDFVDGPAGAPWVHLFHGLEGSSSSPYARTLMHRVRARGWRGSVLHFRGCSGEPNRLQRAYHSGDADEIDWSLRRIRAAAGGGKLYAAGVSLGGNAFAKWLGTRREDASAVVDAAATVSAPLEWKEVERMKIRTSDFHIRNMLGRLGRKGDLFAPVLKKRQKLEGVFERAREFSVRGMKRT